MRYRARVGLSPLPITLTLGVEWDWVGGWGGQHVCVRSGGRGGSMAVLLAHLVLEQLPGRGVCFGVGAALRRTLRRLLSPPAARLLLLRRLAVAGRQVLSIKALRARRAQPWVIVAQPRGRVNGLGVRAVQVPLVPRVLQLRAHRQGGGRRGLVWRCARARPVPLRCTLPHTLCPHLVLLPERLHVDVVLSAHGIRLRLLLLQRVDIVVDELAICPAQQDAQNPG
eukprot:170431-Chlamydomonas_euryale.AAC.3